MTRRARVVALALAISCSHHNSIPMNALSSTPASIGEPAPIYGVRIPQGYRDWALISIATVGAPVNDMRAKLETKSR